MLLPKELILLVNLGQSCFDDFLWRFSTTTLLLLFIMLGHFIEISQILRNLSPTLFELYDRIHRLCKTTTAINKVRHSLLRCCISLYPLLSVLGESLPWSLTRVHYWIYDLNDSLHTSIDLALISKLTSLAKGIVEDFLILITQNRRFYIRNNQRRIINERDQVSP